MVNLGSKMMKLSRKDIFFAHQESFQRFPQMDYVLLVEPDMRPVLETFQRSVLKQKEIVYALRRSGKESRGERLADSAGA